MEKQTLTRQELYDLVWSNPLTTLAKRFSITDVGLRKICIKMGIPLPMPGHWAKVKFNWPIKILKLPDKYSGKNEVVLKLREEEGIHCQSVSIRINKLEKEIIAIESQQLIIPDRLANPHEYIIAAKESLNKNPPQRYNGGLIFTSNYQLDIRTTNRNIGRVLRFMNTFIKFIENRGHQISIDSRKTFIVIQGEKIQIYLREKLKRVPKPNKNEYSYLEYEFFPTGILSFCAIANYNTKEWKDGKVQLENQLARIIAYIEIRGEELRKQTIERDEYWRKQEEKERIEKEKQKRKKQELHNFKTLLKSSKRWHKAEILRKYIVELEAEAIKNKKYSDEFKQWILWANKKADWYHPFLESNDEILSECNRNSLTFEN